MRVQINFDQCEGHGRCAITAPAVFRVDAEGYGQVAVEDVPDEERARVERAIRLCPKQAIAWVSETV
ncbi:MAG: ferredoxin [Dehalococcoidia bacterium]|nr:MAG: ferredoxin [Dehalococcoidia bacterium]